MTEEDEKLFAAIDAYEGNTMIVFADKALAMRYLLHRYDQSEGGVIASAEDTRTGSGLFVVWRDRVPPEAVDERIGNCLWLLEKVLDGTYPRPAPGIVAELWKGGFPGASVSA